MLPVEQLMKPEQILAILYEMAIVIGGEIRLQPLLTKTLQRLLFHTSFPCGMVLLDAPELASRQYGRDRAGVRLEVSIGDFELAGHNGRALELPAALLRGGAALGDDPGLLAALPCRRDFYSAFLRLPIDDCGVILLLSPVAPSPGIPYTSMFQPIMNNLAKAILLCRSNEAYTRRLLDDQKRVEMALQDLSYRNRLILESVGEGICGIDRHGNGTFVNPAAARMLGFGPGELIGAPLHDMVHHQRPDGTAVPHEQCSIMRTMAEGTPHRVQDDLFQRRDGALFPVEYVCTPLHENGATVGAVIVFRDITDRKKAEEEIRGLASIVESSDDAIISKTLDGTILSWNRGAERLYGYTAGEVKGKNVSLLIPPDAPDDVGGIMKTISLGGHVEHYETLRMRKDGMLITVSLTVSPVHDRAGRIIGASTITRDITERKKAEAELKQANAYNRSLIEASLDPLVTIGPDGKITDVNDATEKATGRSRAELIGTDFSDYFTEPDRARSGYQKAFREGVVRDYELEIRRRDGRVTPVLYNASLYRDESGNLIGIFAAARDITERKRQENDLRKLNRALRTLSASNMTLIHTRDETTLMQNICKALVDVGAYTMAWVGYLEDDGKSTIRPVAHAGREEGYLKTLPLVCDKTCDCPASVAIRSGKPAIVQDIAGAAGHHAWRDESLARKYASCIALPLTVDHRVVGALSIYAAERNAFTDEEMRLMTEMAGDLSFGITTLRTRIERDRGIDERQGYLEKIRKVMEDTIQAIAAMLEMRDPYIAGHQRRVAQLAVSISKELGLPQQRIEGIHFGSLIHDIGKIYVPAEFLSRPGRLADLEFNLIRTHPQVGYDIMKDIEFPWPVASMIHQHHEHMNGSGYPLGLKGDKIILEARILVVADVVEAMASHRPYRPARGIDTALQEIEENRGILYDADVVGACLRVFREKKFAFS